MPTDHGTPVPAQPPPSPPRPAATPLLAGRYRLRRLLAQGGMGAVHLAHDGALDRAVAVKVLHWYLAGEAGSLARFRQEARAAAALNHPSIVAVYDYGEERGQPFLVMEYVEGETLAQLLRRRGPLPWREAFAIGEELAAALAAAHARGVVHCDVKPSNVLLSPGGRVKLADFGIAHSRRQAAPRAAGAVLGTPSYLAPEQARGEEVGPAADVYSLSCVLFEAITGRCPYRGTNPIAVAVQHATAAVPDPRDGYPDLPVEVAAVLVRGLQKDPRARFASAAELERRLREVREGACRPWPPRRAGPGRSVRAAGLVAALLALPAAAVLSPLTFRAGAPRLAPPATGDRPVTTTSVRAPTSPAGAPGGGDRVPGAPAGPGRGRRVG